MGKGGGPPRPPPSCQVLAHLVTIDSVFLCLRKAKASDAWFWGATVGAGRGNGVAHTAIRQPASIAAVQVPELPGRVELAHLGNLSLVVLAGLLGLLQGELVQVSQVVHLPCGERQSACHWGGHAQHS